MFKVGGIIGGTFNYPARNLESNELEVSLATFELGRDVRRVKFYLFSIRGTFNWANPRVRKLRHRKHTCRL